MSFSYSIEEALAPLQYEFGAFLLRYRSREHVHEGLMPIEARPYEVKEDTLNFAFCHDLMRLVSKKISRFTGETQRTTARCAMS